MRGKLAGLDEEQRKLEDATGAESESLTQAPWMVNAAETTGVIEIASIAESLPIPQRAVSVVKGALAFPKLSEATQEQRDQASVVPPVSYYTIEIPAGSDRFELELPSGAHQNLFLISFTRSPLDGRLRPTHVAAALDVTMKAQSNTEVVFGAYAAGAVVPQFLPPTIAGLRDSAGNAISALPSLSCLAVAKASAPRPDFPPVSLARMAVGSVATQLQEAGVAGLFILPTGRYRLDCFAAFAGRLFGVDPKQPLEVEVKQGELLVPTAGLINVRDVLPNGSGGTVVLPPDTSTPGSNRYQIRFSQISGGVQGSPIKGSNYVSGTPASILIQASTAEGFSQVGANERVRLEIRPAFDALNWGQDVSGGRWLPLDDGRGPMEELDVQLVDGLAVIDNALRTDSLMTAGGVHQYIATIQAYDVDQRLLRREGAFYFTISDDTQVCASQVVDHVENFALTDMPDILTLNRSRTTGIYAGVAENVLVVAASASPDRCAVSLNGAATELLYRPLLGADASLVLSTSFSPQPSGAFSISGPAGSQSVIYDAIQPAQPSEMAPPAVGSVSTPLDIETRIQSLPLSVSHWFLRIRVRETP
jgi:hypothetical protein